jgi:CRP-like cAMP-binding protein
LSENLHLAPLARRWSKRVQLSQEDREAILALPFRRETFAKDAYLLRQGEQPAESTLLLRGFAYRQKLLSDGGRQIIAFLLPGDFADLQPDVLGTADHNVQSLNRSEVAIIPRSALIDLAQARPAIGTAMWMETLTDASIVREWVVNVGRRDSRARIAHLLCEIAIRMKSTGANGEEIIDFPVTQEQLADATGLTPVHTNRMLQGLRRDGFIQLTSGSLKILDWQALRQAGDFEDLYLHQPANN